MRSNTEFRARLVRVRVRQGEAGLLFATSPDLRGLLVAERTAEELEVAIPQAVTDLYAACGEAVVVSRMATTDAHDDDEAWVAFPAEIARKALVSTT